MMKSLLVEIALFLMLVGCVKAELLSTNNFHLLNNVVQSEQYWITEFFNAGELEELNAHIIQTNSSTYIVIQDISNNSAILFEMKLRDDQWEVVNRGFGRFSNGKWKMWSKNDNVIFESQGGVWTVAHYQSLISRAKHFPSYRVCVHKCEVKNKKEEEKRVEKGPVRLEQRVSPPKSSLKGRRRFRK